MKIALVTDAWKPQTLGLVTALVELVRQLQDMGHQVVVIHPGQFDTRACPGFPGFELAWKAGGRVSERLKRAGADAIHIATEGPLGWAARRYCLRRGLPFSTSFDSTLPEILRQKWGLPLSWGYAVLRHFHRPSRNVLVSNTPWMPGLSSRGFKHLRAWAHGVDGRLFPYAPVPVEHPGLGHLPRPLSLYVGRLSEEKNLTAFLEMDVPGSRLVCGEGPQQAELQARYPGVHWMGVLPRSELAQLYAAADVFVFPCRHDTFGLAMLEALSCGTPVAGFPVDGARQVLGDSGAGALHADLRQAWKNALHTPRRLARERAEQFGWARAAELFLAGLAPLPRRLRREQGPVPRLSLASSPVPLSSRR